MNSQIKQRIEKINNGEVPDGYKRTDIGIIPLDWSQTKLGLIASHVLKKNINYDFKTTFTNSATKGVIKQTDFFDKEISNNESISGYYIVQENDYIYNPRISVSAPCGPINKSHFCEKGIVSPLYIVFRMNGNLGKSKYIELFFESSLWHRYICGIANYGARHDRMNITNKDFFSMPIPLPSLDEQKKIAEILATQDKVIELKQRKIEELKKLKKYYLNKMFPQKGSNYPEVRFHGFTDSWKQCKLGDICSRVQGNDGRMELPVLTISAANGWMKQEDRFSENIAGSEQKNYTLLKRGELSYNHGNSKLAKYGTVFSLESYKEALVPRVYHSFMVNVGCPDFIEYYFATKSLDRELSKLITSGARMDGLLNIGYNDFMGINVILPSSEEQKKIATYFRKFDNFITLHQRELDEEKKLKKSLMQLLLTGIVRV